jgi:DNA-binding CsgD family transcriptional regulator
LQNRKSQTPNGKPPSKLQSPFTERRKGEDRRKGERRKADRRQGERRQASPQSARKPKPPLTRREREILDLLLQGMTNRQIAHAIGIGEETVKKHLYHVYRKLGLHSRSQLIIEQGLKKR